MEEVAAEEMARGIHGETTLDMGEMVFIISDLEALDKTLLPTGIEVAGSDRTNAGLLEMVLRRGITGREADKDTNTDHDLIAGRNTVIVQTHRGSPKEDIDFGKRPRRIILYGESIYRDVKNKMTVRIEIKLIF